MTRRISVILLVLIADLLIATPVLAYLYRAQVSITESNGTDYDMLGVVWDQNNDYLAANGYMDADALDTRVQNLGGTNYPWLVSDNKTLTATTIDGNGQVNLYFITGETPATDMDILVGDDGYVTISDAAALELGDDFKVEFTGWVGDDGTLVGKDGSFNIIRDGTDVYGVIENATTFPNVSATSSGQSDGAGGVGDYPAGIAVGDLVIVTAVGRTGTTLTLDAELTELWKSGSAPIVGSYYRIVDGTEGATFTYVTDGGNTGFVAYRIDAGSYYGTPEVGTATTATSANPDSPSVTTSYETSGSLWIATFGTGGAFAINVWPTNYAGSQTKTGNNFAASCTRDLVAASEDPGAWTTAAGETWIANTIVVRAVPTVVTATGIADGKHKIEVYADGSDLKIEIDDSVEDTVALAGSSCDDNAADWVLYPDPYWEYYEHTVSGTLVVDYDPEDIISGTTLPDLEGAAQDGAITWGSNPGGVSASVGSMVSSGQGVVGEGEETETSDILPPAGTTDWNETPDVSGALLTNPMRPLVVAVSDNTSLSERQVWVYFGLILLLLVTAGVSRIVHGHHLITGIAAATIILGLSVMTIWPLWALVFAALAVVGGLVAERSPSL